MIVASLETVAVQPVPQLPEVGDATLNVTLACRVKELLVPVTVTAVICADVKVHDSVVVPEPDTLVGATVHATLLAERLTTSPNPFMEATAIFDDPAEFTLTVTVVGIAETVKSWTVTLMFVVRESVLGAVPVVPVTSTLKGATPEVQLTARTAPLNAAMHPAGTLPAVKVTVPVKLLIGVTVTVDVPATVARVVIAGADNEKS
jgi:hypothetical protein